MRYRALLVAVIGLLACPVSSRGQVFNNNGLFEPTIDVVNSGVKLDVQATVSADRKYVTMTMRPQNSQLLELRIGQVEQNRVGRDLGAGQDADAYNGRVGLRGNELD